MAMITLRYAHAFEQVVVANKLDAGAALLQTWHRFRQTR
jgi:hypothetical protein